MLGRKQSLRPEPILSDYGPDEALSEHADIEWVTKNIIARLSRSRRETNEYFFCRNYLLIFKQNFNF